MDEDVMVFQRKLRGKIVGIVDVEVSIAFLKSLFLYGNFQSRKVHVVHAGRAPLTLSRAYSRLGNAHRVCMQEMQP